MIKSVGIDFHQGKHVVRCLDEGAQLCDSFSFQATPEGLDTFEEPIFHDGSNPVIVFEPAGLTWFIMAILYPSFLMVSRTSNTPSMTLAVIACPQLL